MQYLSSHLRIPWAWIGIPLGLLVVSLAHGQQFAPNPSPFQLLPATAPAVEPQDRSFGEFPIQRLPNVSPEGGGEPFALDEYAWPEQEQEPEPTAANDRKGNSPFGGDRSPLSSQAWWIPTAGLSGQPGDLTMSGVELKLAFPLAIDEQGIWLASGGMERLEVQSNAVLPDSGIAMPEEFWNLQFGVMHFKELADGWRTGGMLTFGSASDKPFDAARDLTMTMIAFLSVPVRQHDAWNFSVMYSPTGQLAFPIPGVSYTWNPSETFRMNLGVPFSVHYEPAPLWSLDAGYTPLVNGHALATRTLSDQWSVYGGYRTVSETFFLAERTEDDERFFFFDQRLMVGIKHTLWQHVEFDFSVAYVFDRQIFQAEQFTSDKTDRLQIDPSVAGSLQLSWKR